MQLLKLNLLVLLTALMFASCGNEEDEIPENCDVLQETLVGTWSITNLGGESGELTLQADGTLIDDSGVIIDYENNGVAGDIKTWSLDGNDLTFRADVDPDLGSGFAEITLGVTSFDCNEVVMDVGGIASLTMRR